MSKKTIHIYEDWYEDDVVRYTDTGRVWIPDYLIPECYENRDKKYPQQRKSYKTRNIAYMQLRHMIDKKHLSTKLIDRYNIYKCKYCGKYHIQKYKEEDYENIYRN